MSTMLVHEADNLMRERKAQKRMKDGGRTKMISGSELRDNSSIRGKIRIDKRNKNNQISPHTIELRMKMNGIMMGHFQNSLKKDMREISQSPNNTHSLTISKETEKH
jgi:hypothetical protein